MTSNYGVVDEPGQASMIGLTMVSARSKSGRRWEVFSFSATYDEYLLRPLGDDVRPAQEHGRMNGGVRRIFVPYDRLRDQRYWRKA